MESSSEPENDSSDQLQVTIIIKIGKIRNDYHDNDEVKMVMKMMILMMMFMMMMTTMMIMYRCRVRQDDGEGNFLQLARSDFNYIYS